jgi:hypothetical protein
VLGFFADHLLSAIAIAGILCVGGTVFVTQPVATANQSANGPSARQLTLLFGPFTLVYLLLLSHRGMYALWDRYLLALIFLAIVCVTLFAQRNLRPISLLATGAAIAAIAFYGVITTHNTFALDRARVAIANEVLAAGLPPSSIDLGVEMNGWYELQLSTHVNDPRVLRPAGAYIPYPEPIRSGCHAGPQPFEFLPHLAPRYGLAFDPKLCEGQAPFAPVSYSTWPLRHPTTLYVIQYPPPWQSPLDLAHQRPSSPIR